METRLATEEKYLAAGITSPILCGYVYVPEVNEELRRVYWGENLNEMQWDGDTSQEDID